jgi:dienelactone hydrolase
VPGYRPLDDALEDWIMRDERWPREAWIPLIAGLFWLWNAPSHGLVGFLFSVLPGSLLLGSGVAMLLMPGDLRISQYAALGGVLGLVAGLPAFVFEGLGYGLVLAGLSAASFVAAGAHTVRLEPHPEGVPPRKRSFAVSAEVAIDEALLSTMSIGIGMPSSDDLIRIRGEIEEARVQFEASGWLEKPVDYHVTPPPLESVRTTSRRTRGIDFEHISFDSGYAPREGEPGAERWRGYAKNQTAHAWVVRSEPDRPWLVCIHGYQMGKPAIDLSAFRVDWFRDELGLNLLLPVLPLHGPRTVGRRSGDGFLAGEVLDTIHAEAQAMWDIRRMLGWIRGQGAPSVGVYGLSLGGYNASLLAALDDDLACVVAGIPATDFSRLYFRHGPALQLLETELSGIEEQHMAEITRVVSPLVLEPRVPHDRRYIFAAVADRLVPADQVRDLWRHWDEPRIEWYQGGHITFPRHPGVRRLIHDAVGHLA